MDNIGLFVCSHIHLIAVVTPAYVTSPMLGVPTPLKSRSSPVVDASGDPCPTRGQSTESPLLDHDRRGVFCNVRVCLTRTQVFRNRVPWDGRSLSQQGTICSMLNRCLPRRRPRGMCMGNPKRYGAGRTCLEALFRPGAVLRCVGRHTFPVAVLNS